MGNDVREYLNVSFRGAGGGGAGRLRGPRQNGGASRRNFIKRVFACFTPGTHAFIVSTTPPVASGTITRSNSPSRSDVYACARARARARDLCACMRIHEHMRVHAYTRHACMHTGRACGRSARAAERSMQKLRNESPRVLTLARRPPKSRLSSFRRQSTSTRSTRAASTLPPAPSPKDTNVESKA